MTDIPFRSILDTVADGVLVCAPGGKIVYANAPARRALSNGRQRAVEGLDLQAVLDLSGPGGLTDLAELAGTSEPVDIQGRPRAKDHPTLSIRATGLPEGAEARILLRFTPDHGPDQAQSERLDRLEAIIESLPIATFAVDNDKRIIAWNRALEQMTGIAKADMLGRGDYAYAEPFWGYRRPLVIDLIGVSDPNVESYYEHIQRVGDAVHAEVHVPKLYRERGAYVVATATPLFDKAGRRIGAVECVQDVTGQKEAEWQLRRSEEQLRQAQRMESIGRLAGGIAHDFNNQLTVVEGYCDLMLREDRDAQTIEALKEIRQASARATRLTAQLLAFGRRQVLQPEVLDLHEVLTDIENPLARMIGEDIDLSLISTGHEGNVRVDRNQLQQVVMNLAVNARDAMPTGGNLHLEIADVQITAAQAASHPNAAPGWYVLLKVRDTGLGMDAETLSQAFEPFFTTKPVGQGTGLGLSMVYGFVSQSGGFVEVDSQPDQGTELRLYLPRVDEPATSRRPAEEDLPAEPQSGAGTILVVEDEERVETLITRVLTQCGYHVLSARNTPDAIKLADKCSRQPDLLITDVVMPGQSGLELTSLLRKDWPDLKVLFISGYAHDVLRSRGQGHIEGDFLSKPFTPESLSAKVAEILDLP